VKRNFIAYICGDGIHEQSKYKVVSTYFKVGKMWVEGTKDRQKDTFRTFVKILLTSETQYIFPFIALLQSLLQRMT
jgi:hypothetical protein